MKRKVVLLVFISILLFSTVTGTWIIKRGVDVGGSGESGPGVLSGSGESGSVDWWPMFHHDLAHTGYSASTAPNTNQTLWTHPVDSNAMFWPSSPAVANGKVFIGSKWNSRIYALNETSGVQIWSYPTGAEIRSSPAVVDGMVFVGSYDGKVYALNESTGTLVWSYTTGGSVHSSPAVAYGMVFVGSLDNRLYALNQTTGKQVWNYTMNTQIYASPAVADGKVFIGEYGLVDYGFRALNATNGALVWRSYIGYFESSPAVGDGRVFVGSMNNRVYALNETNGNVLWSYLTGDQVYSSPAVADGKVFIGSGDGKVYALDATNGALLWNYATGAHVYSSPAIADGIVFVGSRNYRVYALNEATGAQIWSYTTGGNYVDPSPAVADGKVFIASSDGKVYAFGSHDVAITSVTLSTTEAYSGQTVNITVGAKNDGTFKETFNIRTYYDSTLIGTQTVTDLPQDEETTLTFSWNTTDIAGGYYTISANATIVPGETHTADNNFIDGTVKVTSPVRIKEVIPCNQTGYSKNTFQQGTMAYVKVIINSTALIPQNTLITVNLYDYNHITIGIASFQGPILPGISTLIFGLPIPTTATIGTATVYANCYTDWPSQGGFPHCPEMSATLEITGP